eukprot:CFRG4930T1
MKFPLRNVCSMAKVIGVSSLCSTIVLSVGLYFLMANNSDPNYCLMTYMYEPVVYTPIPVDVDSKQRNRKYRLLKYNEGRKKNNLCKGHPILFIPGNSGSYQQVRSIASISVDMERTGYQNGELKRRDLDFFTIDFNEELSALYGGLLSVQSDFALQCMKKIQSLCDKPNEKSGDKKPHTAVAVSVIGHSMGGLVAISLLTSKVLPAGSIESIFTIATPHRPVLGLDSHFSSFYRMTNAAVQKSASNNVTLVSIETGIRDAQVRSDLSSLVLSAPHIVHTSTNLIPGAMLSCDHLAAVWCKQVVMAILKAIHSVGSVEGNAYIDHIGRTYEHAVLRANQFREVLVSPLHNKEENCDFVRDAIEANQRSLNTTGNVLKYTHVPYMQTLVSGQREVIESEWAVLAGERSNVPEMKTHVMITTESISFVEMCVANNCALCSHLGCGVIKTDKYDVVVGLHRQFLPYWRDTFVGANVKPTPHPRNHNRPVTTLYFTKKCSYNTSQSLVTVPFPSDTSPIRFKITLNSHVEKTIPKRLGGFVAVGCTLNELLQNESTSLNRIERVGIPLPYQHLRMSVLFQSCLSTSSATIRLVNKKTQAACDVPFNGYFASMVNQGMSAHSAHFNVATRNTMVLANHVLRPCEGLRKPDGTMYWPNEMFSPINLWMVIPNVSEYEEVAANCELTISHSFSFSAATSEFVRHYAIMVIVRAFSVLAVVIGIQISDDFMNLSFVMALRCMIVKGRVLHSMVLLCWWSFFSVDKAATLLDDMFVCVCAFGLAYTLYGIVVTFFSICGIVGSLVARGYGTTSDLVRKICSVKKDRGADVPCTPNLDSSCQSSFPTEIRYNPNKPVFIVLLLSGCVSMLTLCPGIGVLGTIVVCLIQSIHRTVPIGHTCDAVQTLLKSSPREQKRYWNLTSYITLYILLGVLYVPEILVCTLNWPLPYAYPRTYHESICLVIDFIPSIVAMWSVWYQQYSNRRFSRHSKAVLVCLAVGVSLLVDSRNFWYNRYSIVLLIVAATL